MLVNILCMWDREGDQLRVCVCACVCSCQLTLSRLGLSVLPVAVVTSVRPSFSLHSLCPFLCAAGSGPVERHRHDCVIRCQIESNRAFIVAWRHLTRISLRTCRLWHSVIDSVSKGRCLVFALYLWMWAVPPRYPWMTFIDTEGHFPLLKNELVSQLWCHPLQADSEVCQSVGWWICRGIGPSVTVSRGGAWSSGTEEW